MKKTLVLILVTGFWLIFGSNKTLAITGTISGSSAYAWGENIGWINFLASGSGITITDTGLTGYAWSSNYGWINLSPSNGGVTNNCSGELGGLAWSSTLGWIDFSGVQINSSGKFIGTIGTVGTSVGRIIFDCSNCNVETDWRPSCVFTPTSSSNASSTSSGDSWSALACTATKPGSPPIITKIVSGENSATLTWIKAKDPVTKYLIAYGTKSGSIEFGNPNVGNENTTSYTVNGLSSGTRYYFKIKAINDCMPGDYSSEVVTAPSGNVITTTAIGFPATGFLPITSIDNPSQLFDIALIIDETQITKVSDLNARVTFINFGRENTPVEMTFTVVDEKGKEYYRSVDKTTIQTEGVFNKTFKGITLPTGKYTLILNTLYNTNFKDEFKQGFEIGETVLPNKTLMILIGSGIILILVFLIILLKKRRRRNK